MRWDAEGFGTWRQGGLLPAPGARRGPGVCRRCYERVYPDQVWDPNAPLGWLAGVEPPDPRFNKVVRGLCPGGDERLELPHKGFGGCDVWQGVTAKSLFGLTSRRCSRRAVTSPLDGVVAWML